jgi:hypothetical protein
MAFLDRFVDVGDFAGGDPADCRKWCRQHANLGR